MWKKILLACIVTTVMPSAFAANETVRIKDLGKIQGWRENALVGYGIVTGLAGTGDSMNSKATKQALANVLSQFNFSITSDQIQSRNVAIVMVTATLPAFSHEGDAIDVNVTSVGDARSLVGGSLLLAPLKGSSHFTGERILDFQKEVGCVPKSVSHALDDLDAVVDAFQDR